MTRPEIIELVHQLTERKSENVIDPKLLLAQVLQEFCDENRFWWRKRSFSFNTVSGQATYDLSAMLTAAGLVDVAVQEITSVAVVTSGTDLSELSPVFDDMVMAEAAEDTGVGVPGTYSIDFSDYKTLRLLPNPSGVYKIRLTGWLTPNASTESTSDVIPLLPPWTHRAIVHGMEAYIWRIVYGMEDPKYMTAKAAYDKAVTQAQIRQSFTTNTTRQFLSGDHAIQSTR